MLNLTRRPVTAAMAAAVAGAALAAGITLAAVPHAASSPRPCSSPSLPSGDAIRVDSTGDAWLGGPVRPAGPVSSSCARTGRGSASPATEQAAAMSAPGWLDLGPAEFGARRLPKGNRRPAAEQGSLFFAAVPPKPAKAAPLQDASGPAQQRIFTTVSTASRPLGLQDISRRSGVPYDSTRVLLTRMVHQGLLSRAARGAYTGRHASTDVRDPEQDSSGADQGRHRPGVSHMPSISNAVGRNPQTRRRGRS